MEKLTRAAVTLNKDLRNTLTMDLRELYAMNEESFLAANPGLQLANIKTAPTISVLRVLVGGEWVAVGSVNRVTPTASKK